MNRCKSLLIPPPVVDNWTFKQFWRITVNISSCFQFGASSGERVELPNNMQQWWGKIYVQ